MLSSTNDDRPCREWMVSCHHLHAHARRACLPDRVGGGLSHRIVQPDETERIRRQLAREPELEEILRLMDLDGVQGEQARLRAVRAPRSSRPEAWSSGCVSLARPRSSTSTSYRNARPWGNQESLPSSLRFAQHRKAAGPPEAGSTEGPDNVMGGGLDMTAPDEWNWRHYGMVRRNCPAKASDNL